jgi:hypothetical protein
MPRYFFHLLQVGARLEDREGQVLEDADEAWEAARATARELMAGDQEPASGWLMSRFEVVDQTGEIVFDLAFLDAAEVAGDRH